MKIILTLVKILPAISELVKIIEELIPEAGNGETKLEMLKNIFFEIWEDGPEELWPIAVEMQKYGRVILAGALTPDNVSEAIKVAKPYAVDVASGVDKEPGKKDHSKVRDFIFRAKS